MAMSLYNFKKITVVPSAPDLKEAVLSKTQRKTPTVVHKHYSITRIRAFYNRKVKFAQQTLHDKFTGIVNEFPQLDDVHPFYADLMNILYDRDHYKIALGQISTAKALVDKVSREYVRLMKYGDSLYRCKQLKRAALGRMMKIIRHQRNNLSYLEQVRQHLSRLPSIEPNTRTLLLCGFPNVGKSSLLNTLTRANVDVQPYAFTTKSLYVGHMDYKYLRWQLIDTPGILDHSLEERNTIEMQAVTALAHIRAAVLYMMDLSEQCNETIESQVELFRNIRPLFTNKPVFIGLNKCDVRRRDELTPEQGALLDTLAAEGVVMVEMSAQSKHGVIQLRDAACDALLAARVEARLSAAGDKKDTVLGRVYVAVPKPRDDKPRPAVETPQVILERRMKKAAAAAEEHGAAGTSMDVDGRKLEKHIEMEMGDDYMLDLKKHYDLENPEEKYDKIPEIWNGHNVADFIDTDIVEKLESLRAEERAREAAGLYDDTDTSDDDDGSKALLRRQAAKIRYKQELARVSTKLRKNVNKPVLPRQGRKRERSMARLKSDMGELGVDLAAKRMRHAEDAANRERPVNAAVRVGKASVLQRYASAPPPRSIAGLPDTQTREKVRSLGRKAAKPLQRDARKGESDRHVYDTMPKHLFAGKRKMGKTSRR